MLSSELFFWYVWYPWILAVSDLGSPLLPSFVGGDSVSGSGSWHLELPLSLTPGSGRGFALTASVYGPAPPFASFGVHNTLAQLALLLSGPSFVSRATNPCVGWRGYWQKGSKVDKCEGGRTGSWAARVHSCDIPHWVTCALGDHVLWGFLGALQTVCPRSFETSDSFPSHLLFLAKLVLASTWLH